jgi:hypothetical protein
VVKEDDKEYVIHGITSIDGQRIPLNQIPNWFNNDPGRGWEFANATEFQMVIDEILNIDSDGSKWKLTSLSAEEAINKFGKETVRIGFLKMRDNSVSVEVDSERSLKEAWYNPFTWFDNNKDTKQEFDKTKLLPTKPIRKAGEQLRDRKKLMKRQLDSLRKEMGEGLDEGMIGAIGQYAKAALAGGGVGYAWHKYNEEPEKRRAQLKKKSAANKAVLRPPPFQPPVYGDSKRDRSWLQDYRTNFPSVSGEIWKGSLDNMNIKREEETWNIWDRRIKITDIMNGVSSPEKEGIVPTTFEQSLIDNAKRQREMKNEGVGIITSQNTTDDVKPGETQRQAKKFGNIVDKDGRPPLLQNGVQSPELTTVKLTETFKNLVK